jgi:hypothetical protein
MGEGSMKRVPMTFLVLAVTGGCMIFEPDPIEDPPYASPRRLPVQPQSWSYQPQSSKAAVQKTNDKPENTLVKAAYAETKPAQDESPPVTLGMLRLTNNKRLTFHCDSSDTASSGAANLAIWGTTDMRTWKKYEATSHSPSSLAVEVKDEGLYGFTIIARGKGEPATDQPPAGEPPQVWVAVDLTKPVVQLLDAEMKDQTQTSGLIVRWNAKDRNLGPQPITVLYAEHPDGPWRPLAANLENSGRYEGILPPHLAGSVYLRVQAADLMGNVGMSKTTELHLPSRPSTNKRTTDNGQLLRSEAWQA